MTVIKCHRCRGNGTISIAGAAYATVCPYCAGNGIMPAVGELGQKLEEQTRRFTTGAVRSTDSDDVRYDLIPPESLRRLAERFAMGSKKYGDDNWKKRVSSWQHIKPLAKPLGKVEVRRVHK